MKKADIWRSVFGCLLAVGAAGGALVSTWMAEAAGESKPGLPQLDVELYPGIGFWLIVAFFLFFLFMKAVGVKGVRETQANRASLLGADLSAARAASEEAKKIVAEYEADLAKARRDAQATVNEILTAAANEAELLGQKMQKEMAHRLQVAEENIAQTHQTAMEDAPKFVNALVNEIFGRVMHFEIGTAAQGARN